MTATLPVLDQAEFVVPQDCAAHRLLAAHGVKYAFLNPIYLGGDLFSPTDVRSRPRRRGPFPVCLQARDAYPDPGYIKAIAKARRD